MKKITNYKIQITNNSPVYKKGRCRITMSKITNINQKLLIGKRCYESLVMMPRLHPETNENQHKRFAQHIGSPRRGAPGRWRQ
jgi:hypothetical protein